MAGADVPQKKKAPKKIKALDSAHHRLGMGIQRRCQQPRRQFGCGSEGKLSAETLNLMQASTLEQAVEKSTGQNLVKRFGVNRARRGERKALDSLSASEWESSATAASAPWEVNGCGQDWKASRASTFLQALTKISLGTPHATTLRNSKKGRGER